MSASPDTEQQAAPSADLAQALYFDSGAYRLFGWLHSPPLGKRANIGLIVCNPFGYEAVCAHRSVRGFAEAAANLGVPTLRFDYAGAGDSSEIDPQADQLEVWTQDVIAAVAELQRRSGVERVCLLGFRLGALLAMLAASRCRTVSGLVLIAPIVSGRRYLRDLRMTRLAASIGSESPDSPSSQNSPAPAAGAGSMEVSGFVLSAATIAALAKEDLKSSDLTPTAELLVIDGTTLPGARTWTEELSGRGVRAKHLVLPGMVEMLMTAPQFASVPREMIAATSDWLTHHLDGPIATSNCRDAQGLETSIPLPAVMQLATEGSINRGPITERPLFLPSQALLFGIATEPAAGDIPRGAVILINSGATYHISANGMYVDLPRRWARQGYLVLRMDLAGIGDSGTRPGRADDEVFPPAALDDIRAAVEWVRTRYQIRDIALLGVCSGAYHALRAAVTKLPVTRILMINPEVYFWNEEMSIYDTHLSELVREPQVHRKKMLSSETWKKLLSGRMNIRYLMKIYARRILLALESKGRDAARYMRIRLANDLGSQLEEIAARGVRMVFVFARGEPGIDLLKLQAGISLKRLGEGCRIHIIDSADHVFSKRESRTVLEEILDNELLAPIN